MARRTIGDIEKIWTNVEGVKKLSDRAVGIGPFGIGLDGLLTWVPVVGTVYSVGAAGWLLLQAARVKASPGTVARMVGYLGLDSFTTLVGEVPFLDFVPSVVDVLFPGHLLAARALQKDIETTHWVEASEREARATGEHERHVEEMRKGGLRRLVYLHD
ncbi:MAG: DUF4112 domain-containing protein [Brevundimonas sp.]|uniref:DUF4112 domain-containing protein n=1 Tax=Brevundimonas sp. TaxID=1871086 RepID=UPI002636209A|nr:DUF4112 domain-containing protein [Brevundimonas sp.]MDI6625488.1 DUF4112 domain-containing protein [Brevundimonas sp.]MDQ7812825.1 DUF4112 domain-containing protein [Brevundimonas sp.]